MRNQKQPPLAGRIARTLRNDATELADRWIERHESTLGVRPRHAFHSAELREHAPRLIHEVVDYIGSDTAVPSRGVVDHLRELARVRREQGYDGATEFIPVSSTGHLMVVGDWLSFTDERAEAFSIFIQLGAILVVI